MQHRTRKAVTAILVLAAIAAVTFAVHLSLNPDNYFFYHPEDRATWVYHPSSVAFVCSIMFVEVAVAWAAVVIPRPRALWLRSVIGLAILGPWAYISTMVVVHMPAYTLFHHLWVWLLVMLLAVVAVGSAARQLYFRLSSGPPNNSIQRTQTRYAGSRR